MYPVGKGSFSVGVSDVIVRDEVIAKESRILCKKERYSIISVGSLAQMYKAPDIVLLAMEILKNEE